MNNKDFKQLIKKIETTYNITLNELNKLNPKQKKYILKNFNFITTL